VPSSGLATAEFLQFGCFTWLVAKRLSIADCSLRKLIVAGANRKAGTPHSVSSSLDVASTPASPLRNHVLEPHPDWA
jgi:hypothetical protein